MTIDEHYQRHAYRGRALLHGTDTDPKAWIVRFVSRQTARFVGCDDTLDGWLYPLHPDADLLEARRLARQRWASVLRQRRLQAWQTRAITVNH